MGNLEIKHLKKCDSHSKPKFLVGDSCMCRGPQKDSKFCDLLETIEFLNMFKKTPKTFTGYITVAFILIPKKYTDT